MGLFSNGQKAKISSELTKLKTELVELKSVNAELINAFSQSNLFDISQGYVNQNVAHYAAWNLEKQVARYSTTDDIYSITNLIATTSALIPLYCYEKKTGKKALTELDESDALFQLMEKPHLFMSKFEFHEALHKLLMMQGEVIIYKVRGEFGSQAGQPVTLEFLESPNVVRFISDFPHAITKYEYRENGKLILGDIPPEDIIHIRYFKGISPLQALHRRLERMDSEMDVSVAQLQNGGVPGVLYDENDDGTNEVPVTITNPDGTTTQGTQPLAENRKINFYRYLQNRANKGAPYMSAGKLGYVELGLKLADMSVEELSNLDFKKLCNAFNVSDRLFNNDATGSEVSDDNAQKALYTRAGLPAVYRVRDAFNASLVPDFSKDSKRRTIKEDITEIPALQGDMLKMAQAYAALPCFIPNEIREMFHQERIEDGGISDKVYIKTGYTALEDLQGSGDLPITEDYNQL